MSLSKMSLSKMSLSKMSESVQANLSNLSPLKNEKTPEAALRAVSEAASGGNA
ncbi:hypothetical protein GGP55_002955 [Salinibacter ruber]|uniref:Uncharacterized protein n=1 Tax=Salinibacter ruber TaxID=146919 RepID=A0A9X2UBE3_9BACT|nr:hypothetical protein [Salinibacter ruber]MCS3632339.1 hypothetical protein [Salinibacter ruber]MCS3859850.1 hypothetical protein [Salinibacter ruber]MCS3866706.1 hypothetical protein [Salinibacter ruber]MCS3953052.1 hypothetical protein [Salinibacter ruber]